jgi:hypothetical protein
MPAIAGGHALVGEWQRETTCAELVRALTGAGMADVAAEAAAGNGFIPGVQSADQLADPNQPCRNSIPRTHSHFFTTDGSFGSRDWNGNQVDEGMYEVDDDNIVIAYRFEDGDVIDVHFHFRMAGNTVAFEPVIPTDCSTAHCREAVGWSVSVAYLGKKWTRVR